MFTGEERNFIEKDPGFYRLLQTMSKEELTVFRELVTYICDLNQEERKMFFTRIDELLTEQDKLERKMENMVTPPPYDTSKMTEALKNKGYEEKFLKEYRSMIFTEKNFERFSAGDQALMDEIENWHDEWTYFGTDFGDTVVVGVKDNE